MGVPDDDITVEPVSSAGRLEGVTDEINEDIEMLDDGGNKLGKNSSSTSATLAALTTARPDPAPAGSPSHLAPEPSRNNLTIPGPSATKRNYIQKISTSTRSVASSARSPHSHDGHRGTPRSSSSRSALEDPIAEHYANYLSRLPHHELSYNSSTKTYSIATANFTVDNNAITIAISDGDERRRPLAPTRSRKGIARPDAGGTVRISDYEPLDLHDHSSRHWRGTIGRYIAAAALGKANADHSPPWVLADFPQDYQLFRKTIPKANKQRRAGEGDESREDIYLYGSDTSYFSSPAEFVLHAIWLMHGANSGECYCKYCYRRPDGRVGLQEPITQALEGCSSVASTNDVHLEPQNASYKPSLAPSTAGSAKQTALRAESGNIQRPVATASTSRGATAVQRTAAPRPTVVAHGSIPASRGSSKRLSASSASPKTYMDPKSGIVLIPASARPADFATGSRA